MHDIALKDVLDRLVCPVILRYCVLKLRLRVICQHDLHVPGIGIGIVAVSEYLCITGDDPVVEAAAYNFADARKLIGTNKRTEVKAIERHGNGYILR